MANREKREPEASGKQGLKVMEVIEALYTSAKENREIAFHEFPAIHVLDMVIDSIQDISCFDIAFFCGGESGIGLGPGTLNQTNNRRFPVQGHCRSAFTFEPSPSTFIIPALIFAGKILDIPVAGEIPNN